MPRQGRQSEAESDEREELIDGWCRSLWNQKKREIIERTTLAVSEAGYPEVLDLDPRVRTELPVYGMTCVLDLILGESEQGNTHFLATEFLSKEWLDYKFAEQGAEIMQPVLEDDRRIARNAGPKVRIALVFEGMDEGVRLVSQSYQNGLTVADMLSIVAFGEDGQ